MTLFIRVPWCRSRDLNPKKNKVWACRVCHSARPAYGSFLIVMRLLPTAFPAYLSIRHVRSRTFLPIVEFFQSLNYIGTGAVEETRTPALLIKSQLLSHLSYNRIVDCYLCTDGQSLHPQAYIYEKPYRNLAWFRVIKKLDFVKMYWIWTNITILTI